MEIGCNKNKKKNPLLSGYGVLKLGAGWRGEVDSSRDWVPTPIMASSSVGAAVNKDEISMFSTCPLENWSRGLWVKHLLDLLGDCHVYFDFGRLAPGLPGVGCHFFSKNNPPLVACLSL
ncbi:hypothetical protein Chor_009199 [Crotalus horridus]